MELVTANASLIATQDRNAQARQDLQNAARDIRDQVRHEIQEAARARGQADQAAAAAAAQAEAAQTGEPRVIVTPMPERHQIVVGGSQFPPFARDEIPPQAVDMAIGFFVTMAVIIIGLPISRAFARRMDRKAVPPPIPAELTAQLGQLTQAVDAIALEVERISEGQRFTTRLLAEQRDAAHALQAGHDR